jgi:hypothetical protein
MDQPSLLDYRLFLLDEGIGDFHGTVQRRDQDDGWASANNKTQGPLLIQQAAILGIYRVIIVSMQITRKKKLP